MVAADVGGWGRELTFAEDDSRDAGRWPEDASVSSGAGQVAFTASGRKERFTINLPRTAGSALREARAAAASTAAGAEVGEARVAAIASMGRQGASSGCGSAAASENSAATCRSEGLEEGAEERPDLVAVVGEDAG
jgi:hypothetical protein